MEQKEKINLNHVEEKELNPTPGGIALALLIIELLLSIAAFIYGVFLLDDGYYVVAGTIFLTLGILAFIAFFFLIAGLHIVNPNEALVLTYFGQYYGTIKKQGFYYTHPLATAFNPATKAMDSGTSETTANFKPTSINIGSTGGKKISTKTMTLNNEKQKVNDVLGNPIIIGAIVIWKVSDPTKAVFNVENYKTFLSIQCDSTIRNVARLYPYDSMENDSDEKTLRGSSQEIADSMKIELQQRVEEAGLEVKEVRITHLSYSEENAAARTPRQQAGANKAAP
ncbi:hypothetical protein CG709_02595, partial [Lachnotalea glycerini]